MIRSFPANNTVSSLDTLIVSSPLPPARSQPTSLQNPQTLSLPALHYQAVSALSPLYKGLTHLCPLTLWNRTSVTYPRHPRRPTPISPPLRPQLTPNDKMRFQRLSGRSGARGGSCGAGPRVSLANDKRAGPAQRKRKQGHQRSAAAPPWSSTPEPCYCLELWGHPKRCGAP